MENQIETHLQYVDLLNEWDPFQLKDGGYEPEIADTIQAIHELNEPLMLAERIQCIYEFSFEKKIPLDSCLYISKELLAIKANESCSI